MPSSPFLYHSGFGVFAAIAALALVASFLTLVVSTLLLWLYRRTVAKLMSAQAGVVEPRIDGGTRLDGASLRAFQDSDSTRSNSISLSGENDLSDRLYRLAIFEPRRHAHKYALAGVLFALVTGLSGVFALSQTQVNYLRAADHPFQFLFMFWTCAWRSY